MAQTPRGGVGVGVAQPALDAREEEADAALVALGVGAVDDALSGPIVIEIESDSPECKTNPKDSLIRVFHFNFVLYQF